MFKVTKTHVWANEIPDRPGSLADALETLTNAGANLECVIARRKAEKRGTGVMFLTPLRGKKVLAAARRAGFNEAGRIATLRVEGNDKPGAGAAITQAVGDAGINMRGLSAAVVGRKFVVYLGFDSEEDAAIAARAIRTVGRRKR